MTKLIKSTIDKIKAADDNKRNSLEENIANIFKKINGSGGLSEILVKYASKTNQSIPRKPRKAAIIACGDHGVCQMNVSAYPQKTTVDMTRNYLISKGSAANAMTSFSAADMFVVDMGVAADMSALPGLIDKKIAFGTDNFVFGRAMSRENALKALETGIELAEKLAGKGYNCFLLGEMGIANTTSSAAIAAAVCGLTAFEATGRGTNISDSRLKTKIDVVNKALLKNQPDPADGIDLLSKIGGFEFGCLAGVILGAAANRCLVILDGFNTAASALIAQAVCSHSADYLMPSHLAGEPAHQAALKKLGLTPYIDLQFQLSETAGSSVIARLIDLAVELYDMAAFDKFIGFDEKGYELLPAQNELDEKAMEICQERIDNLTKPIKCLGKFEEIAVYLAGVLKKPQPKLEDVIENRERFLPYILRLGDCLKLPADNLYIAEKIGFILIEGALHMLNDMKTFAEAAVAVASDGPGAGRQKAK